MSDYYTLTFDMKRVTKTAMTSGRERVRNIVRAANETAAFNLAYNYLQCKRKDDPTATLVSVDKMSVGK